VLLIKEVLSYGGEKNAKRIFVGNHLGERLDPQLSWENFLSEWVRNAFSLQSKLNGKAFIGIKCGQSVVLTIQFLLVTKLENASDYTASPIAGPVDVILRS
jgi:hypothetical protein